MGSVINKAAIRAAIELLASKHHDALPRHILNFSTAELLEVKKGLEDIRTHWTFSNKSKIVDNLAAKRANERAYDALVDSIDHVSSAILGSKNEQSTSGLGSIERLASRIGVNRHDSTVKLIKSIEEADSDDDDYLDVRSQLDHAPRMSYSH